jgi:cell division protein FtsW (lipid II flippase)
MTARGRMRLDAWLDPFSNATTTGWQVLQALVAYYTGGLWGVGFGAGSPNAVPIVESDFVWAIVAEELGLAGCAAALLLYAVLVFGGMRIASRAKSAYASCVATGLSACLGLQTLLNVGGVVKAIPLTGIPLPLLSHGGSSLVATLVMVGLLLAISDESPTPGGAAASGAGAADDEPIFQPRTTPIPR